MKTVSAKKGRRKSLAAYYTNVYIAKFIANLAISDPLAKVADFSCGEGNLLISACQRKTDLHNQEKAHTLLAKDSLHCDLIGIDIDEQAAKKAQSNLSTLGARALISITDATFLQPGKEVQGIDGNERTLDKVDVIIMNPPFLRQDRLSVKQKTALKTTFIDYSPYFSGRTALYAYFLFLADQFIVNGGKIAFVLPATIFRVQSTLGLRKFLLTNYSIKHLVLGCETAAFSKLAQFREVIIIAENAKPMPRSQVAVSFLRKMPISIEQSNLLSSTLNGFLISGRKRHSDKILESIKISQCELTKNDVNLYSYLCGLDSDISCLFDEIRKKGSGKLVTIDTMLKNKGITINRFDYPPSNRNAFVLRRPRVNSRFKRNANEWTIDLEKDGQVTIVNQLVSQTLTAQKECFARGLRRTCKIDSIDLTSKLDLVVVKPFKGIASVTNEACLSKLNQAIDKRKSNLLLSRRIDVSSPGTRLLAFYSNEPAVGVDMFGIRGLSQQEAKVLVLWFNSSFYLLQLLLNRTETTGAWLRLDVSALKQMSIIDFEKLDKNEETLLIQLFHSLTNISFPSIISQLRSGFVEKKRVDSMIAKLIGYSEGEISDLLDRLYLALAKEIQRLRQLMYQGHKYSVA